MKHKSRHETDLLVALEEGQGEISAMWGYKNTRRNAKSASNVGSECYVFGTIYMLFLVFLFIYDCTMLQVEFPI